MIDRLENDIKFEFLIDSPGNASAVTISYRDGRPTMTIIRTG